MVIGWAITCYDPKAPIVYTCYHHAITLTYLLVEPGKLRNSSPEPALKCSGLFPAESGEFDNMKTAFERLSLNDAALFYEPENSVTR